MQSCKLYCLNGKICKITLQGSLRGLGDNSPGYNGCGPNKWQCKKTGLCISINSRCDNYFEDCGDYLYGDYDQSDEENCDCIVNDEYSQNTHSRFCPSDSPICSYGICKASAAQFEPCPSNYCKNGGTCRVEDANLPNNAKCECPPAFAGVRCADGNSTTEMLRGFGSGSGRINHENEGGYGLELVDSAGGGYASGSGSGGVVTCRAMDESPVSDSWCETNCQGGSHPACQNSSGADQRCICESISYCVNITTGPNGNNGGNQGYLSVSINGLMKKQGWFDRNQIVLEECFDELMDISVQNNNNNAWAGTIVVKRNDMEVPLTCSGCEGSPFDKKIAVDGNSDGEDQAQTYCLNGKICKITLQAENHAAENTGPVELQGNQLNQNTQKSTWRKNCKGNGLCGGGSRSARNHCDTRDYKILSPEFCGNCLYGWRRSSWPIPNDCCCSYNDIVRYGDCKCHASNAPECPNAQDVYTCQGNEGKYIACYVDDIHRDLKDGPKKYGYNQQSCNTACQGYTFYSLQNHGWCACGNDYSTKSKYAKKPESECGGARGLGGPWRNSVYRTCIIQGLVTTNGEGSLVTGFGSRARNNTAGILGYGSGNANGGLGMEGVRHLQCPESNPIAFVNGNYCCQNEFGVGCQNCRDWTTFVLCTNAGELCAEGWNRCRARCKAGFPNYEDCMSNCDDECKKRLH